MSPREEYEDAVQDAALAILQAPNIALGVHAAKMDALDRYRKRKRREPPPTWLPDEEGRWPFQSCQFDPSIARQAPAAEE